MTVDVVMGTGLATAGQDGEEIFLERNTQNGN
jgi:hypothetical protein